MAKGLSRNGKGLDEPTRGHYRPLPEVSGRRYRPRGDNVLVRRERRDNPPEVWHASTPDPNDEEMRWYWIFFKYLVIPAGIVWAAYRVLEGGLLG